MGYANGVGGLAGSCGQNPKSSLPSNGVQIAAEKEHARVRQERIRAKANLSIAVLEGTMCSLFGRYILLNPRR